MQGFFEYKNEDGDKAELSWSREGDLFYCSSVTFRNGQVYRSKSLRSKDFQKVRENFNSMLRTLEQNGFSPIERV
jgi:hypothetical protein